MFVLTRFNRWALGAGFVAAILALLWLPYRFTVQPSHSDSYLFGFNNSVAVAGSAEMVAGWEQRSAELRKRHPGHLDLRYGPRERNRIDFIKASANAPTLLFIPGNVDAFAQEWSLPTDELRYALAEVCLEHAGDSHGALLHLRDALTDDNEHEPSIALLETMMAGDAEQRSAAAEALEPSGRRHLITSAIEHEAVLNTMKALGRRGWRVTTIPVSPVATPNRSRAASSSRHTITTAREPMCFSWQITRGTPALR